MLTDKKGFTLAELLIVVVILGVLGALVMPKFYPQKEKAIVAQAVVVLSVIRQGELSYRLDNNGVFLAVNASDYTGWGKLGMDNPNDDDNNPATALSRTLPFSYQVVLGADSTTGTAIATRTDPQNGPYNTRTVVLDLVSGAWSGTHPRIPTNN
jgi:prepilin-type N-terminal cleavage/methylation domain-containing protein